MEANTWDDLLLADLSALDNDLEWTENLPRGWATGGATVDFLADNIDANIALHDNNLEVERKVFLVNIGANDQTPLRAAWKEDCQYVVDALVNKWPTAEIYLAKPWHRTYEAAMDSIATWIDEIVVANPTSCHVGHDERDWLEGGDNGATMSSDGVHYTTAGQAECARQWKTILGY